MSRRICIVIDPWDYPFNGTVVSTRRFVRALETQYSFKLLGTPDPAQETDCRMVRFSRVSLPGFNAILNAMKVPLALPNRRLLRKALEDSSVLHVQFPFFLGFAAISEARKLDIPVVCSFHVQPENLLLNVGIRSRWLVKLLYILFVSAFYNRADLVIAPSEFAADVLRANGLKKPVKVISNGVPEQFLTLPRDFEIPDQDESTFKLLSVGRLAKEKCQDVLLHAIARSKFRHRIQLTIVGTGPMEDTLKKLVVSLGLGVKICSVSDKALMALYGDASLFIHAGEIELEGMSVVEAMAAGNTVLVSDSKDSATARLVEHPRALFKNEDPSDLAAQIDYWLANPAEKLAEARINRERARRLSHEGSVTQISGIYNEFLAFDSLADGKVQLE